MGVLFDFFFVLLLLSLRSADFLLFILIDNFVQFRIVSVHPKNLLFVLNFNEELAHVIEK
jgi:hypothetical protein